MPTISYYDMSNNRHSFLKKALGTKAIDWKHEEEIRLVRVDGSGLVDIPPQMVDGVVFGMRIDPKIEHQISEWSRARSVDTELLRVVHVPDSFELTLEPAGNNRV